MSASETGEDAPLVHFFNSVRNSESASLPASCTVFFSSAASRIRNLLDSVPLLTSANRQFLDPHRRSIHPKTKFQVVGRRQPFEHLKQMARNRDLADRVGDLAVLDPESGCATTIVASHAVDARANQVGDVEPLFDIGNQLG